jgi:cytochrome b subunit of formate dehydrogenase
MGKKVMLIAVVFLGVLGAGLFLANTSESLLFDADAALWVIVGSVVLGFEFGAIRAKLKGREEIVNGAVVRHGAGSFLGHWGTALGIFVLITSAFILGFLFFPAQMNTTAEAIFPLNLHFTGVVITLFGGFFFAGDFLVSRNYSVLIPTPREIIGGFFGKYFLRRKWRAEGKYIASVKAAFLLFAVLGAGVLITGAIKLAGHVWPIQASVLGTVSFVHDIFALLLILMVITHLLFLFVLPAPWTHINSWFTGKVPEEFVKEEHPIWYEELKKNK